MNKKISIRLVVTIALFLLFSLFTFLVVSVDVKNIGADGTAVGFSTINSALFAQTGLDLRWYKITGVLGYFCIAVIAAFAVYGVYQLIKYKSLTKVDKELYALLFVQLAFAVCYIVFELLIVNYRPIKLDGELAASYPSTHTIIAVLTMSFAIYYLNKIIDDKYKIIKQIATVVFAAVAIITVVGRLLSGVHWLTDIIGALLLSSALIALYLTLVEVIGASLDIIRKAKERHETEELPQSSNID